MRRHVGSSTFPSLSHSLKFDRENFLDFHQFSVWESFPTLFIGFRKHVVCANNFFFRRCVLLIDDMVSLPRHFRQDRWESRCIMWKLKTDGERCVIVSENDHEKITLQTIASQLRESIFGSSSVALGGKMWVFQHHQLAVGEISRTCFTCDKRVKLIEAISESVLELGDSLDFHFCGEGSRVLEKFHSPELLKAPSTTGNWIFII